MRRRSWLRLGLAGAAVLAVGGGAVALVQPAWQDGRLLPPGRRVFTAMARAFLDDSLPAPPAQAAVLAALLSRVEALVAALPRHAPDELAQLLALLASAPGRTTLAGLGTDWDQASIPELQQALQAMRVSSLALRQQAYQALHDITGGAYFSDETTWQVLGYPGPMPL